MQGMIVQCKLIANRSDYDRKLDVELQNKHPLKVLFVSPEVSPFARTGGLGEVVGSLPLALEKTGVDVRILCPLHKCCKDLPIKILKKNIIFNNGTSKITSKIGILAEGKYAIPVYFLINDLLFDRNGIYSDKQGNYPDNSLRSFVLCHAASQIETVTKWKPDIVHAHDWMASATCAYINAKQERSKSKSQGSLLTIHNLEHQGVFTHHDFKKSGLPEKYWGIDGFEHHRSLNLLKGGIQHADKISTVSPTYAKEIRTSEHGQNLEESLCFRGADLVGILNGIDTDIWNPMTDSVIPHPIDPCNPVTGKEKCKEAILKGFNLSNQDAPLFGVVSRLYYQKGLDLLLGVLPEIMSNNEATFIILGSGEKEQEDGFLQMFKSFPGKIGVKIGFDDILARKIFAGSDFFLMPSRFEPCGLAQQYAMRYGSVPIGRKTGGLSDTIVSRTEKKNASNGYLFEKADQNSLKSVIFQALEDWSEKKTYSKIQNRAMEVPCSWEVAAQKYAELYSWISPNK